MCFLVFPTFAPLKGSFKETESFLKEPFGPSQRAPGLSKSPEGSLKESEGFAKEPERLS